VILTKYPKIILQLWCYCYLKVMVTLVIRHTCASNETAKFFNVKGATEEVFQFLMPVKSIYSRGLCFNKHKCRKLETIKNFAIKSKSENMICQIILRGCLHLINVDACLMCCDSCFQPKSLK
jgi:hypothetical protein